MVLSTTAQGWRPRLGPNVGPFHIVLQPRLFPASSVSSMDVHTRHGPPPFCRSVLVKAVAPRRGCPGMCPAGPLSRVTQRLRAALALSPAPAVPHQSPREFCGTGVSYLALRNCLATTLSTRDCTCPLLYIVTGLTPSRQWRGHQSRDPGQSLSCLLWVCGLTSAGSVGLNAVPGPNSALPPRPLGPALTWCSMSPRVTWGRQHCPRVVWSRGVDEEASRLSKHLCGHRPVRTDSSAVLSVCVSPEEPSLL